MKSTLPPGPFYSRPLLPSLMAGLLMASICGPLQAADGQWTGLGEGGLWSDVENWGNVPGATTGSTNNDIATFVALAAGARKTVIFDSDRNLRTIYLNVTSSGNAYSFANREGESYALRFTSLSDPSSEFTIRTNVTSGTNVHQFDAPIVLEAASSSTDGRHRFQSVNSSYLLFSGPIQGGVTSGKVTLNLTGNSTGLQTFQGEISDGGAAGGLSVVVSTTNGPVTFEGANTYSGGTVLNTGTGSVRVLNDLAFGTGLVDVGIAKIVAPNRTLQNAFRFNENVSFEGSNGLTFKGAVSLGSGDDVARAFSVNTGAIRFDGVISEESGSVGIRTAHNGQITLNAVNTFTGGVTHNVGTLALLNDGGLGTGVFRLGGGTLVASNRQIQNETEINGNVSWTNTGGLDFQGLVFLGSGDGEFRGININSGTVTISGVIADRSVSKGIEKTNNGILALGAANTFSGGVRNSRGTVIITHDQALGGGTYIANGGTLLAANRTIANEMIWEGDALFSGANVVMRGNVSLGEAVGESRIVNVGNNQWSVTLSGAISDGRGGLGKRSQRLS